MATKSNQTAESIQKHYYTKTADKYDEMHLMDPEHNLALEYIHRLAVSIGLSSVLDVGCGTGRGVKFLLNRGVDVTGIEPVRALLETGRLNHLLPADRMLEGSGESLPFSDAAFDASMELGVLHHVPNPAKVVAEMIRVSRRAIFISDCNRFGQGSFLSRLIKIGAWKTGLWKPIDLLRTRGKGYTISKEDGLAYSYSVYDSFDQLADWADEITLIPTSKATAKSWLHPLATCSHVLLVAMKSV